jgi:starvation-inducible DNA-binding protein
VKSRTVLEHIRQVERDLVGLKGGIDRLGSFACFGDLNMRHTHNTLSEKSEKIHRAAQQTPGGGDRLHGQVKHAHWNVRGPAFIAIHELFDKIADKLEDYSDTLAERAVAVGGTAHRTVQVAAKRSFLVPYALGIIDEKEHIFTLSAALATIAQSARQPLDEAALAVRHDRPVRKELPRGQHSRAVRATGPRSYRCPRAKPRIPATTMSLK